MNIFFGTLLYAGYGLSYFLRGCHGFFCKFAYFVGNYGKATASVTCAGGFNGGVQSQQVCLVGYVGNNTHDLANILRLFSQSVHIVLDGGRLGVYRFNALDGFIHNL